MNSEIIKTLDSILSSKTIEVLEALGENDFSVMEIKYSKSTLYHLISKLREANLLERREEGYCLTHTGKFYLKLKKFCKCLR